MILGEIDTMVMQIYGEVNKVFYGQYEKAREDKGDREGIPHAHPNLQVIRLELFLESG